jgi:hypothetical protein
VLKSKCLTATNTLAYHGEELITTVKSFMIYALGWSEKVRGHEKGGDPPNLKSKKQNMLNFFSVALNSLDQPNLI